MGGILEPPATPYQSRPLQEKEIKMQNQLIQTQQKQIGTKLLETISARGLHNFLGSKRDFSTWIKSRIAKYDFQENTDYLLHKIGEQLGSGTKYKIEYYITVNMAKELELF